MNDKDKVLALMQQAFDALETTADVILTTLKEEEEAEYAPVNMPAIKLFRQWKF